MNADSRRIFLKAGTSVIGAMATGSATPSGASSLREVPSPSPGSRVAAFGWEVTNLNGNGADVYFPVQSAMSLRSVNIDVAFVPTSLGQVGLAEVLCLASVSRGAVPTFNNAGGHAYIDMVTTSNFGSITVYNPNGLSVNAQSGLGQDEFYAVILKSWVPVDGSASSASRQVLANPSLSLNEGDYLVFHMDHAGVPGDAEMQVVLTYSPS
jgi:hypothetical protein